MERYDSIEYNFEETEFIPPNDSIATTDSEGFITSQQYAAPDETTGIDEYSEDYTDPEPPRHRDKNSPRETVLALQLTVCILLAIAAYAVKNIGGELYEEVRAFYYDNINNSIIIDIDNNNNSDFVSQCFKNAAE